MVSISPQENSSKNILISKARKIAEIVHGTQTDKKGYPYMAHVNDVAKSVQSIEYIKML